MGDIVSRFDLPEVVLDYVGDSPTKVIKKIPSIYKDILDVGSSKFYEDEVKWDVTGNDISFLMAWRGNYEKASDRFTNAWIQVIIEGTESKEKKSGKMTITIGGFIEVKMPYESSIEKFLRLAYLKTFYSDQVRKYISIGTDGMKIMEDELRKLLGIMVRE